MDRVPGTARGTSGVTRSSRRIAATRSSRRTAATRSSRRVAAALAAVAAAALPGPGTGPAHADRDALWSIVDSQCVRDTVDNGDPAPCAEVDLSAGVQQGYAVLKDDHGAHQYLLMPTARITGLEDPALRNPLAPNYFAEAWRARHFTEAAAGGALPPDAIGLAVNSAAARSQDQLHIHIDCVRADVRQTLAASAIDDAWSPVTLAGKTYQARAIPNLDAVNPIALSADWDLAHTTLVVVGAAGEQAGVVVLRRFIAEGEVSGGEELQDHQQCPAPVAGDTT